MLPVITANMQSKTGFPSSHQLKSYVAPKPSLKLAACAVLSADAGLLVTNDSVRGQTKLVDLRLVVADRRHAILGHIVFLKKHWLILCYSILSMSQKEVILQQAGSIHQVDHGKHGYNKSSRIRTVTLT